MSRILFILAAAVIAPTAVASGDDGIITSLATALAFGIAWRPDR